MKKFSKIFAFSLAAFFISSTIYAQVKPKKITLEFDHNALHVNNLQKSVEFYENVLKLEKISEPFKDNAHVWFRMGAHEQLHLIGGGAIPVLPRDIGNHFSFRVTSIPDFIAQLDQMNIKYYTTKGEQNVITNRPDGIKQVYITDPDGYWIEINDNRF
ncbi:MAG: VOC family protein [Pseudomonadota bacterium]